MSFTPPPPDAIATVFPEVKNLNLFAKGGFKAVFWCTTAGAEEVFKLVCLPAAGISDDEKAFRQECLGRIKRELDLLEKCGSTEIVKLASVKPRLETISGIDFIGYTEERLEGADLWKIIQAKGTLPNEQESRRLMLTLVVAIQELWGSLKTVHRDIKPCNIIKLSDPGRPFVLLDLGIAFGAESTALTVGASHRLPVATYRYFAPEMAKPDFRQNLDYRADLYASALTVFEFSTQKHPLAGDKDDIFQTVSRAVTQAPASLKSERSDYSDEFCQMIDQMLKKKPALRPSNLMRLREFLEGRP
jgi:serine/threonine protein kinase